jgi:peptidoglycan-associated lipoprotein
MLHRRGSLFLVAPLLILALFLVGCPKRPATMAAVQPPAPAPPPTPPSASITTPPAAPEPSTPTPPPVAAVPTPTPAPTPAPSPAQPPKPSEFTANPNLNDIYFDFDKYNIRSGDAKTLDANAAWLKSNPGNLVLIEGHCDERGTNEYNLALGERRAKSTMNYLVAQGVQASRITIISYGKERPSCTEHNEACWAKNRRAHFLTKAQ